MSQYQLLKELSHLTEANWAALICHNFDSWSIKAMFHNRKGGNSEINRSIADVFSSKWANDASLFKRPLTLNIEEQANLDCLKLYIFKVGAEKVVLVGTKGVLDSRAKGIWKLISPFLDSPGNRPADAEVGLLQNTVLELQLTQQELQARINAQREAETRLIQAAKLAAVGEMAAGIAHELNNPLTTVVGFTELALEDLPQDATLRSDLEMVLNEARRASSVVRRLLDFARQSETVRVKSDINEIVDDVLILSSHMMQANNVLMEKRYGENLKWVSIDPNQIKQVVINLVNNAIYAMPEGGKILVQTLERPRYGRDWITLSIQDTGIGITSENLERIFEPFFTTRGDRGGTGLGLSVTYGIITDHGGMIEVESQVKVGSTFIVWLPLDETL